MTAIDARDAGIRRRATSPPGSRRRPSRGARAARAAARSSAVGGASMQHVALLLHVRLDRLACARDRHARHEPQVEASRRLGIDGVPLRARAAIEKLGDVERGPQDRFAVVEPALGRADCRRNEHAARVERLRARARAPRAKAAARREPVDRDARRPRARMEAMSAARRAPGIRRDVAVVAGVQACRRAVHGQAEPGRRRARRARRAAARADRSGRRRRSRDRTRAASRCVASVRARFGEPASSSPSRKNLRLADSGMFAASQGSRAPRASRRSGPCRRSPSARRCAPRRRADISRPAQGIDRRAVLDAARAQRWLERRRSSTRLPARSAGRRNAHRRGACASRRRAAFAVHGDGRVRGFQDARGDAAPLQHARPAARRSRGCRPRSTRRSAAPATRAVPPRWRPHAWRRAPPRRPWPARGQPQHARLPAAGRQPPTTPCDDAHSDAPRFRCPEMIEPADAPPQLR